MHPNRPNKISFEVQSLTSPGGRKPWPRSGVPTNPSLRAIGQQLPLDDWQAAAHPVDLRQQLCQFACPAVGNGQSLEWTAIAAIQEGTGGRYTGPWGLLGSLQMATSVSMAVLVWVLARATRSTF